MTTSFSINRHDGYIFHNHELVFARFIYAIPRLDIGMIEYAHDIKGQIICQQVPISDAFHTYSNERGYLDCCPMVNAHMDFRKIIMHLYELYSDEFIRAIDGKLCKCTFDDIAGIAIKITSDDIEKDGNYELYNSEMDYYRFNDLIVVDENNRRSVRKSLKSHIAYSDEQQSAIDDAVKALCRCSELNLFIHHVNTKSVQFIPKDKVGIYDIGCAHKGDAMRFDDIIPWYKIGSYICCHEEEQLFVDDKYLDKYTSLTPIAEPCEE